MVLTAQERKDLGISYGIRHIREEDWPLQFQELLNTVQDIGNVRYKRWIHRPGNRQLECPTLHALNRSIEVRVEDIRQEAEWLRDKYANLAEADWRHNLEKKLFSHLDEQVICPKDNCQKWLWKSYKQAPHTMSPQNSNLEKRRNKRQLCNCQPPYSNPKKSSIFAGLREGVATYEATLQKCLEKTSEKPDLFYGLLCEDSIRKVLGNNTRSRLRTTMFKNKSNLAVFPFLISEAKSGNASMSQNDVESQVMFIIREALLVQMELAELPTETASSNTPEPSLAFEPLVWCISYRGETVDILAACLDWKHRSDDIPGGYRTNLMRLWSGDLTSRDGALRCLLIVDYIADWARDIYRANIVQSLQRKSIDAFRPVVPVSRGPTVQSDIYSRHLDAITANDAAAESPHDRSYPIRTVASSHESSTPDILETEPVVEDELRLFDTKDIAYRDARFIRSKFAEILITDSTQPSIEINKTCISPAHLRRNLVQGQLVLLSGTTILKMKQLWLHSVCESKNALFSNNNQFYVALYFSAYFLKNWTPVRQLICVAISSNIFNECFPELSETSSLIPNNGDHIIKMIEIYNKASITSNFSACINGAHQSPYFMQYQSQWLNIFDGNKELSPVWMGRAWVKMSFEIGKFHKAIKNAEHDISQQSFKLQSTLQKQDAIVSSVSTGTIWKIREIAFDRVSVLFIAQQFHQTRCIFWTNDSAQNLSFESLTQLAEPIIDKDRCIFDANVNEVQFVKEEADLMQIKISAIFKAMTSTNPVESNLLEPHGADHAVLVARLGKLEKVRKRIRAQMERSNSGLTPTRQEEAYSLASSRVESLVNRATSNNLDERSNSEWDLSDTDDSDTAMTLDEEPNSLSSIQIQPGSRNKRTKPHAPKKAKRKQVESDHNKVEESIELE